MLENLLATCGLNATEQKIFSYLLERGASLAGVISKRLNLKRPNVYAVLDNLVRIGVVVREKRNEVTYFSTVPVQIIPAIFEQQAENKFDEIRGATKLLKTNLQPYKDRGLVDNFVFENTTIESIVAVYSQLEDALSSGDFCAVFNPQKVLFGKLDQLVEKFIKKSAKTKANIREIIVAGPLANGYKKKIVNPNHLIKEIPAESKILTDLIMVNGSVYFLDYEPKNEVAIKITHKNHYQSMMTLFEVLWNQI